MAHKKAFEVEAWLKKPTGDYALVLFYGPDRGLVSERARAFAGTVGLPLDDPFSVIRLDAAEMDKDPGRLLSEANTVPMFSTRRLLWVRNGGAQKSLGDDVKTLLASPPRDVTTIVEAGDLKKTVALRSVVEAAPLGLALPCYGDEARDLDMVLEQELAAARMTIAPEARQLLRQSLGGDRLASRGEIQKLLLYAHGQEEIRLDDVMALTGDVSGSSADDAVDLILDGQPEAFDAVFTHQISNGSQTYTLLGAAIRQFGLLDQLRAATGDTGRNAAGVVASARPPVFFGRRKLMERAVERWSAAAIRRALERLQAATLLSRQRQELSVAAVRQALLATALEGARRGT